MSHDFKFLVKTMEEWKEVKGYEGLYEISNHGRVKSVDRMSHGKHIRDKILKGGMFSNGYPYVCLRKKEINKNHLIHRLVAVAFLPNPHNLPEVNHIDGDKSNNSVENLEWCNRSYNLEHAVKIGLVESQCKIRRSVTVKRGEKIVTFKTMKDCAAFFGFKKGWLQNQIRKHGCNFNYKGYVIEVHERECFGR